MTSLNHQIRIRSSYTRSINLQRDSDNLDLINAYLPTSKSIQALEQIAEGLTHESKERSLALIGPYGSGKSAFALYLSALLGTQKDTARKVALTKLEECAPHLSPLFNRAIGGQRGYLHVAVNGIPASLTRQILDALALAAKRENLDQVLVKKIYAAAKSTTSMNQVLQIVSHVQDVWASVGGSGVLIEVDELGKFLEYESYNPQHSEIHLLQLLAEHAQKGHVAPLHLVVIMHQAFEQYTSRVSRHLREEWQKVQGRFSAIAFLEPSDQALRVVSAAFERDCKLPKAVLMVLDICVQTLSGEGALAYGLDKASTHTLLEQCYPLHPLTTLILPVLCQKVAQNERTLFSYLGSREIFGFGLRLEQLSLGDWIEPWEIYDYFIHNQIGGFSDPLTYHRWVEVVAALERFDAHPDEPAIRLLKTIGLLNLIGGQRGLKASPVLLELLFGSDLGELIERLERASIIHFRSYSQEYRVWQGTDFDLNSALQQVVTEFSSLPLVQTLNQLAPLRPIVARRASIVTGSLRAFVPRFVDRNSSITGEEAKKGLRIWYYLAEADETEPSFGDLNLCDVVALCPLTERLRDAVIKNMALRELPKRHASLHQDPVAQREHRSWLANAEEETNHLFRKLFDEPEALRWYWERREVSIKDRHGLQQQLSVWAQNHCYFKSPLIRNELINWDYPSPSANLGRKRLLAAMLTAADQPNLGIEKTPAEMSLYLSLLKASHLHRQENGLLGIYPPEDSDPCELREVWIAITELLGNTGARQVQVTEIYTLLRSPPYGVKLGVMPVLLVAYLLAHKCEVAFYQEGGFCEEVTQDQIELLCRRPELFALERFDLGGLRGDLFDQYFSSIVGKVRKDATLLDIVRPLVRFISSLPPYTQHCISLSREAAQVRDAFSQAKSPGMLLFEALPKACGILPAAFSSGDPAVVEQFIQQLVKALRELKGAYDELQLHWQGQLSRLLLDQEITDLSSLRLALATRYRGLDLFTPDRMGLGAFIRRLAESGHASDQAWLESVATLLARAPQQKWREENRLQAELRLHEISQQLRDLEKLRMAVPDKQSPKGALLIKMVDAEHGEISQVLQVSTVQREAAISRANKIALNLNDLNGSEQMAVVAALLERLTKTNVYGDIQHD
jgi:hypothetical protein